MKSKYSLLLLFFLLPILVRAQHFDEKRLLNYCAEQASMTLNNGLLETQFPKSIESGEKNWETTGYKSWTSGFWPGILWYLYDFSHDEAWKQKAEMFTAGLKPLAFNKINDHDIGFQIFCSYGNGYRLTANPQYKSVLLAAADSLATLYNPKVGTLLSWPSMVKKMGWPHPTIIDNMMNLELLFWASKNGGSRNLYKIAEQHALTTMANHFRPDHSAYHVIVYDTLSGKKIKGVTFQGYADQSMWARGQSWAIYGFTMCYRETGNQKFLDFAQQVADIYLKRLPSDLIPYWDFDDPSIPKTPKDASAAAVTASALLELSGYVQNKEKSAGYREKAVKMLTVLSSDQYLSRKENTSFLLHSTGFKTQNSEVNAAIIYADYYFIEALMRFRALNEKSKSRPKPSKYIRK